MRLQLHVREAGVLEGQGMLANLFRAFVSGYHPVVYKIGLDHTLAICSCFSVRVFLLLSFIGNWGEDLFFLYFVSSICLRNASDLLRRSYSPTSWHWSSSHFL